MNILPVLIIASLFLFYSLISRRLKNTVLTAPMIFAAAGLIIAQYLPGLLGGNVDKGVVHILAELTLIFVLFSDAASIEISNLRKDHNLPLRMLAFALPMTIVAGAAAAYFLFGIFTLWEAALLAAILAPTDAALGQSVVTEKIIPVRIRQAISVESGLNDGLALPLVLIFAGLVGMSASEQGALHWLVFSALQIVLGPAVGALVGYLGAKLIDEAVDRGFISSSFEGIAALCVSLIAFAGAEVVQGNGFIAAFVAGFTFGNCIKHKCRYLFEFAESEGQFFTLTTFFVFGAVSVLLIGNDFQWIYVVYALLSLTVIRMIPIALSLVGTGIGGVTIGFLGWFGPRGLASILFGLLIIEREEIGRGNEILSIVIVTVIASILLHGISASFLSKKYGKWISGFQGCEELKPVSEARTGSSVSDKGSSEKASTDSD